MNFLTVGLAKVVSLKSNDQFLFFLVLTISIVVL